KPANSVLVFDLELMAIKDPAAAAAEAPEEPAAK
ncbi:FKBP-type peptidyl-prolyl cis-trans isomerase, partial [Pseudomonas sp. CCI3.1]|nr:FKBP-type peptidyl-prolyl cis-trans isomerase [Pseudomonas sp. CCI3.1]